MTALLLVRTLEEALRARWAADTDFLARGTILYDPRALDLSNTKPGEWVDLEFPRIEFVDVYSASPAWDTVRATLKVLCVVSARTTARAENAHPGTEALEQLAPLAELVDGKIQSTLRDFRNRARFPTLATYLSSERFGSYTRASDAGGDLLRGQGVFEYAIELLIPREINEPTFVGLSGADIDYELAGDPELPTAEDTVTL